MKIGFVAHEVHRRGGMERAASEVLERVAQKHDIVVISAICEIMAARLKWLPVESLERPNLLHSWIFRRKARKAENVSGATLTLAVGTAAIDADVISAQFCHAAFTKRFGGLRGGKGKLRQGYQLIAQHFFAKQERRAYTSRRLKRVIAVSEGVKREFIEHYDLPPDIITVIPNGVDHEVFKPAENYEAKVRVRRALGLPVDAFICLFVGGDWARKGLSDAIRAVARMEDTMLAVVGKGNEAHFKEVAAQANATNKVQFFGSSSTPQKFYAAADVFVFPSRYEAFSLVTLEAAAAGLPIIAPKINGTEELIDDGVNGYFVEMNPDSVYEKLVKLKNDRTLLKRMSENIFATSMNYDWNNVAARHIEVLESVSRSM